jgi:hypothetical protein
MTVDVSPMVHRTMRYFRLALTARRLRDRMRDAIEAIERGSSGAPVLEALKAGLEESTVPAVENVLLSDSVENDTNVAALCAYAQSLERILDRTMEALQPFAVYADQRGKIPIDYQITQGSPVAKRQLTMGDCYKAKEALENYDS